MDFSKELSVRKRVGRGGNRDRLGGEHVSARYSVFAK